MPPQIKEPLSGLLKYIVVIPAYLENSIFDTLASIRECRLPRGSTEVIVVFNYSEADTPENKKINDGIYHMAVGWAKENSTPPLSYYCLLAKNLPKKHAGVGLARKIGMDEALNRFGAICHPDGIILSLDADTKVDTNYFIATENAIALHQEFGGCIFRFAHDISGGEFIPEVYDAAACYELHLRYYKSMLDYIGYPFTKYTIGSCFGVKASFYAEQGGMNRRQAGEDFYFLHKLFPHKPFIEINNTCIHPSPRPSQRVPFGTGAAIRQILSAKEAKYLTYNPQAFLDLLPLIAAVDKIFFWDNNRLIAEYKKWQPALRDFLDRNDFMDKIIETRSNTSSETSFIKRFYTWFDGFKVVKYLNITHQCNYSKINVIEAADQFLQLKKPMPAKGDITSLLNYFRELDEL